MQSLRFELRQKHPPLHSSSIFTYETIDSFIVHQYPNLHAPDPQEWEEILCNPLLASLAAYPCSYIFDKAPASVVTRYYKPGVTDNLGSVARQALLVHHQSSSKYQQVEVHSGSLYFFSSADLPAIKAFVETQLANPLLHELTYETYAAFSQTSRFASPPAFEADASLDHQVVSYSLSQRDEQLLALSKEPCWALSLDELHHIKNHYDDPRRQQRRKLLGLAAAPSDIEMEAIAQSWSEHCKHKIFAATISYQESPSLQQSGLKQLGTLKVASIYRTYIKGATKRLSQEAPQRERLVSVFSDNAGIVRFDPNIDVCIKVETHNSPSALDPYGGALTGILGVNRDILGCGLGAKPIANTDVFCLAPPQWPPRSQAELLPCKLHHPHEVLKGVQRGIQDGGNKSGIPTVNGALVFDRDFAGKPLIFCGSLGVLPRYLADGRSSAFHQVRPGDHILMAGGRIGKDGIHGATMSSLHLGEDSPTSAVQIGDPLTQKKLLDFTLEARDLGLYNCITDNGAGGLSSSIGELAALAPGARIDLARAGVKYPGLKPYELLISESQERMTYGVAPHKVAEFLALAKRRSVEAWDLGEFTANGQLEISYENKLVALLDLEFLHHSLPPLELTAYFEGSQPKRGWGNEQLVAPPPCLEKMLLAILQSDNVRSKEALVRQYDHEVQGACLQTPFSGAEQGGPSDAAIIALSPYGGLADNAIALSCGLNPKLAHYDTYLMAEYAVDEAIRNIVAAGASPEELVLVDNFCWPDPLLSRENPDGPHKLGQLLRCAAGLYEAALIFKAPFVSGKDSMKNDFIGSYSDGRAVKISVPPTVLITALAHLPAQQRRVSTDFKQPGDAIYLLGEKGYGLGCSEFAGLYSLGEASLAQPAAIDLQAHAKLYRTLYHSICQGLVASCHDISDGGLLPCLAECALGGNLGCLLHIPSTLSQGWVLLNFAFNEAGGRFVVSVTKENRRNFESAMNQHPLLLLGEITSERDFVICATETGERLLSLKLQKIDRAWRKDWYA